jgi:hypothetical protein
VKCDIFSSTNQRARCEKCNEIDFRLRNSLCCSDIFSSTNQRARRPKSNLQILLFQYSYLILQSCDTCQYARHIYSRRTCTKYTRNRIYPTAFASPGSSYTHAYIKINLLFFHWSRRQKDQVKVSRQKCLFGHLLHSKACSKYPPTAISIVRYACTPK